MTEAASKELYMLTTPAYGCHFYPSYACFVRAIISASCSHRMHFLDYVVYVYSHCCHQSHNPTPVVLQQLRVHAQLHTPRLTYQ
jgi:hypothetical protein